MTSSSGRLSQKDGRWILNISGSPFEMGYQHGSLLKEKIHQNIKNHLKKDSSSEETLKKIEEFLTAIPCILPHIPLKYMEEMKGLAEASGASFSDILLLNLFPEMFHCCGVTVSKTASQDGTLYHTRVLDYEAGKDLHSSSVIIIAEPKNELSFINITYAGFIGSVTGMNKEQISIGEIGGLGYGHWNGLPMSFLLRSILEEASCLEQAKKILSETKRTCEYYYVIADGKEQNSFSCYATSHQIQFLSPGDSYTISPPTPPETDLIFQPGIEENKNDPLSIVFRQPKDTLLLTGFLSPERYLTLEERTLKSHGQITPYSLMEIIKQPVARPSNLHNVIFHPSSLSFWISHSNSSQEPACNNPYSFFTWEDLL